MYIRQKYVIFEERFCARNLLEF